MTSRPSARICVTERIRTAADPKSPRRSDVTFFVLLYSAYSALEGHFGEDSNIPRATKEIDKNCSDAFASFYRMKPSLSTPGAETEEMQGQLTRAQAKQAQHSKKSFSGPASSMVDVGVCTLRLAPNDSHEHTQNDKIHQAPSPRSPTHPQKLSAFSVPHFVKAADAYRRVSLEKLRRGE